jgi:8-oxo-dGTP diphosphatase
MPTLHPVRVSTKAVIIRDGEILCNHHRDDSGDWYTLPGGGQEYGETLHEALRRECLEEINADVEVGSLCYVRDYIAEHHELVHMDGDIHQIELMFACMILGEYAPQLGSNPDARQLGARWLPVSELDQHRLYPLTLRPIIMSGAPGVVYLGDVN